MFNWIGKLFKWEDQTQEQLKNKGFDPTEIQNQDGSGSSSDEQQDDEKDSDSSDENLLEGYEVLTAQQISKKLSEYKFYNNEENVRHPLGQPKGGVVCSDPSHVKKLRGVGKQMIKQIGKKIISGDFNLTKISFPLNAMIPQTSLENATLGSSMMPFFGSLAAKAETPIERLKFLMTAIISSYYPMNLFLKPINPIIGETLQSKYQDGTQVYCQQISHHPPVSYFLVIGPQNSYRYYGYYNFSAKAGLNSGYLKNTGKRYFEVGDKVIQMNYTQQKFSNVFIGTLRLQSQGELVFHDKQNNLKASLQFGKLKNKPSDYFEGSILQKGKPLCYFDGTYLGYLNFDKVRYWDSRYLAALQTTKEKEPLLSDSNVRKDIDWMKKGDLQKAQIQKDKLQNLQRHDAKIRKKVSVTIH